MILPAIVCLFLLLLVVLLGGDAKRRAEYKHEHEHDDEPSGTERVFGYGGSQRKSRSARDA